LAFASGILLGIALTFRLDLVLAVGLIAATASWGLPVKYQKRVLMGIGVGLLPYAVHLLTAGPYVVLKGMVLDPVFNLRGGRGLPIPPPWDHLDSVLQRLGVEQLPHWPTILSTPAQLALWFWVLIFSVLMLLLIGALSLRRNPDRFKARVLLCVGALGVGMLPQAIQRADSAHLGWVSCVVLAFLPLAICELVYLLRRDAPPWVGLSSGAIIAMVIVGFVTPHYTVRIYSDYVAQSFNQRRIAVPITHHGRLFYYGRQEVQNAAENLLAGIEVIQNPGDRLFVGTSDLRKTPYSDSYLYYLLPNLTPATYFIEMDPGVANRQGSGMSSDLESANIVVLSSIWQYWSEPNSSQEFGSTESSQSLADNFCLTGTFGDGIYELYTRRPLKKVCPEGTIIPRPPGT
jgi:hypothetical protein